MGIKGLYRKLLASILALTVLIGTTGFIFEEHKCTHCGTDYTIKFLNDSVSQSDSCIGIPAKSCCTEEAESAPEDSNAESCSIDGQSCCTYETESIIISDPVQINNTKIEFSSVDEFRLLYELNYDAQKQGHLIFRSLYRHPFGRQTLVLNSQFLT